MHARTLRIRVHGNRGQHGREATIELGRPLGGDHEEGKLNIVGELPVLFPLAQAPAFYE